TVSKTLIAHTAAIAAMSAVVAMPAHATATSNASFSNLTITLTDLDLNDGIAPSLTFGSYGKPYVAVGTHGWADEYISHEYSHEAASLGGALAGSLIDPLSSAQVSLSGANTLAGFTTMSTSGQAASTLDGHGAYYGYASGSNPSSRAFTLSPNTRLTVSVTASLSTTTTLGYNLEADQEEFALASALLGLTGYNQNGEEVADVRLYEMGSHFNVRDDGTTIGEHYDWSGMMSVQYSNLSAFATNGYLETGVAISGLSAVAPVPEPETWGMLLAGLALVGAAGRRKSRRAA
ncbi:MAG: FxDxF family PEP-CTERM protein, partial [Duganella sp.]